MSSVVAGFFSHAVPLPFFRTFLVLVGTVVLAGVLPLRGGHGQHAHAGPGTVGVWQLCALARSERERKAVLPEWEPDPEEIVWPEHDWPTEDQGHRYVGRHRRIEVDLRWRPAEMPVLLAPAALRCITAG